MSTTDARTLLHAALVARGLTDDQARTARAAITDVVAHPEFLDELEGGIDGELDEYEHDSRRYPRGWTWKRAAALGAAKALRVALLTDTRRVA